MALTGLEIFKQLPRTNCKDCGHPTCLAFAMALASGKATLELCPHVSEEANEILGAASAPPILSVKIGQGDKEFEIGNETVLFRHEKRFENPSGIVISLNDTLEEKEVLAKLEQIKALVFDRVGQIHTVNMVCICGHSNDLNKFTKTVKIVSKNIDLPIMLKTTQVDFMTNALELVGTKNPLICGATLENYEAMTALAKKYDLPMVVKADNLENLGALVDKVVALGHKKLILDSGAKDLKEVLVDQTQIRRQALKKVRSFGYPTICFAFDSDPIRAALKAGAYIAKYASLVVLESSDPADILPLITLRLNIYTDPQKPIAVESKIYEIGNVDENSPVFITTNFSLTYFCVAGDVESSRIPSYILAVDTDGISVLTGWAAGKFTPEQIGETITNTGILEKIAHRKIIIPGGVAVLSGKLQELTGMEVLVGPRESSGIPAFLKQFWQ